MHQMTLLKSMGTLPPISSDFWNNPIVYPKAHLAYIPFHVYHMKGHSVHSTRYASCSDRHGVLKPAWMYPRPMQGHF